MRGRFAEFLARLVFGSMAMGDHGGMVRDADDEEKDARSTLDPRFTGGFNPLERSSWKSFAGAAMRSASPSPPPAALRWHTCCFAQAAEWRRGT